MKPCPTHRWRSAAARSPCHPTRAPGSDKRVQALGGAKNHMVSRVIWTHFLRPARRATVCFPFFLGQTAGPFSARRGSMRRFGHVAVMGSACRWVAIMPTFRETDLQIPSCATTFTVNRAQTPICATAPLSGNKSAGRTGPVRRHQRLLQSPAETFSPCREKPRGFREKCCMTEQRTGIFSRKIQTKCVSFGDLLA